MTNANGLILWEGVSAIDGVTPIVAIVTGFKTPTKNGKLSKQGSKVLQVFYLLRDVPPHKAVKTGEDVAVCGDCIHRPALKGACYVVTFQAPLSVWKAYQRGSYARWDGDASIFAGRFIRFGAWGDPAAVPVGTFDSIRAVAGRVAAYTHQWENPRFAGLRAWAMASADSAKERARARLAGFRSFRVRSPGEPLQEGERQCPAADESPLAGRMDCERCGGCDGLIKGAKRPDFSLIVHGRSKNNFTTKEA